jgi:transposase-like protein
MNGHKWDSKTKAMIVLAGLRGRTVAEVCQEYQIRQNQYYKWRDQFLSNLPRVFETATNQERKLRRENARLKKVVGELTIELKKGEEEW